MDRLICTTQVPYKKGTNDNEYLWSHPDAKSIDDEYGRGFSVGDYDYEKFKCPNCGLVFKVELPN